MDLEFERTERTLKCDVKATTYGYADGREPILKIKHQKHVENRDKIDFYFLCEIIDSRRVRLIGYISPEYAEEAGERVEEGETYRPNDSRRRFPSYADNLVVEPDDLRAVWRSEDK